MKFNLEYQPQKGNWEINHHHKIMMLGSCFSDHIGKKLNEAFFNVYSNPGGNYFSPAAIGAFLDKAIVLNEPNQNMFVSRDGAFASLELQNIRANNVEALRTAITNLRIESNQWLLSAHTLIITFGTTVAFNYQGLGWVANNHKQPEKNFERKNWTFNECVDYLEPIIDRLLFLNKRLNILYTVSPVKYLKGGLEQNSVSKSTLILLADYLSKKQRCGYFPAYELVTDDLRDYRFYAEDLAHPNHLAVNYVWEKLANSYFSENTQQVLPLLNQLQKAMGHKPSFKLDEALMAHINSLVERIKHYLPHFTLPSLPEKP